MATLAGAADEAAAQQLLSLVDGLGGEQGTSLRRQAIVWLADMHQGQDGDLLQPLRPDRLGEALVSNVLDHQPDHGTALLTGVLGLGSTGQLSRCREVMNRIAAGTQTANDKLARALESCHVSLVRRSITQTHGSIDHPGSSALAVGLAHAHLGMLGDERSRPLPAGERLHLCIRIHDLADTLTLWGQSALAMKLSRQALWINQELVAEQPENTGYQRELSLSYNQLGDLAQARGDRARARELFEKSLEIITELAVKDPQDAGYQRDLCLCHERLGGLAQADGDREQAGELFEHSLQITNRLAAAEPEDAGYQRVLAVAYNQLGDLAQAEGNPERARGLFEHNLEIITGLAAAKPEEAGYQRDLCLCHERLGDLARAEGNREQAQELFEHSLEIRDRLLRAEPGNTGYQREQSASYERLGELAHARGDLLQAREQLRLAAGRRWALQRSEPWRLDLAEELTGTLYLLGSIENKTSSLKLRREAGKILEPFTQEGVLSRRGRIVMDWAGRQQHVGGHRPATAEVGCSGDSGTLSVLRTSLRARYRRLRAWQAKQAGRGAGHGSR